MAHVIFVNFSSQVLRSVLESVSYECLTIVIVMFSSKGEIGSMNLIKKKSSSIICYGKIATNGVIEIKMIILLYFNCSQYIKEFCKLILS